MKAKKPGQSALDELRRRLASGMYDEEQMPPERELALMLGVGRRALRGALKTLEEEQLIWRRQGRGTFASSQRLASGPAVTRLAHHVNPLELMEARLTIEPILVQRAALRASRADIEAIDKLAESARTAPDARIYESFDFAFHRRIAEASGNALLAAMFEMIIDVREKADWKHVREYYFEHDGAEKSYAEHRLIIEALQTRDPTAAEHAMRKHLSEVANMMLGLRHHDLALVR